MANEIQSSADFGYARVKTGKSTCFSSSQTILEFTFDETDNVKLIVSQNLTPRNFSVKRAEAEAFLSKIFAILEKPQVSSESHCTIYYSSDVEWRNLQFIDGEPSGKINTLSNEFSLEALKEAAAEIGNTKMRDKAQAILAKGVHRHALEIYFSVKDFAKNILSK